MKSLASINGRTVVLGLFGLNRRSETTFPSINHNVYLPLVKAGANVFTVGHFNVPSKIDNPRSNEITESFHSHLSKSLKFDLLLQEEQNYLTCPELVESCQKAQWLGEVDAGGQTRRNLALQLHSLSRLGDAINTIDIPNNAIFVIIRPDLLYIDNFESEVLRLSRYDSGRVLVPRWQSNGGLNDRFCIADRIGAFAYMRRGSHIRSFIDEYGFIHAERLLRYALRASKIRYSFCDLRAARVRVNGDVVDDRFHESVKQRLRRVAAAFLDNTRLLATGANSKERSTNR